MVGSALVRALKAAGYDEPLVRTREQLDLRDAVAVDRFLRESRPTAVLLPAGKVGGIEANNTYRWDFIAENLAIAYSVLTACLTHDVERVVFFGSSCVYPRLAPQPIPESALLTGPLEPTNEPYAIAKIAGIKLVESAVRQFAKRWVSVMPTNLYGPGDNFHPQDSHVIPGLMRRFHEAKTSAPGPSGSVTLWGSGSALREFLHVDDLARAVVMLLEMSETGMYNIGSEDEMTIKDLANRVAHAVGYEGTIAWDTTHPDGMPRKRLDSSRILALGWKPRIDIDSGLKETYDWFLRTGGGRPRTRLVHR